MVWTHFSHIRLSSWSGRLGRVNVLSCLSKGMKHLAAYVHARVWAMSKFTIMTKILQCWLSRILAQVEYYQITSVITIFLYLWPTFAQICDFDYHNQDCLVKASAVCICMTLQLGSRKFHSKTRFEILYHAQSYDS